jgi:hypothetical protein
MSTLKSSINKFRKRAKQVVVEDFFYVQVFYGDGIVDDEMLSLSAYKFNYDFPTFEYEDLNSGFSNRSVLKDIKISNTFSLDIADMSDSSGISFVIIRYLETLIRRQNNIKTSRVVNYDADTNSHIKPLFNKIIITKYLDNILVENGPTIVYTFNNCYIDGNINQESLDFSRKDSRISKMDLKYKFDFGSVEWKDSNNNIQTSFRF